MRAVGQIAIPFPFEFDQQTWTNAVYENAVGEGFVRVPWRPMTGRSGVLKAYFHSGLAPAEAVCACFCLSH
ncbi:hypothetical protein AWB69_08900 [Caballeronia udeis]|uniref:Uncharacterized protein n=1 Tax=Caballeronia udeis TaxID=1232866 RepID=A0A158JXM9_9BURK|nr:hypothetical protein AWB69_08900 [Caballeronia udeis]